MRRDRDDRHGVLPGSVVPEHPPGRRRSVLDVAFPNVLAVWASEFGVLVRVKAGVSGVRFEQAKASPNAFEFDEVFRAGVVLQVAKLRLWPRSRRAA